MRQDADISGALAVLEGLARALCRRPNELRMDVSVGNSAVWIGFTVANASESKQLVGPKCAHLTALTELATIALGRAGLAASIGKVERQSEAEDMRIKFKPKKDWPRARLSTLLKEIAEACFPADRPTVVERDVEGDQRYGTEMIVRLAGELDAERRAFGKAIAVLFLPIGAKAGRRIYADVAGS